MTPYTRHIIKLTDHAARDAAGHAVGVDAERGHLVLDDAIRADDAVVQALGAAVSDDRERLLAYLDVARAAARRTRVVSHAATA